jgi:hypothetical protein
MRIRFRLWYLLLLPLLAIPFTPALVVMLWGRPGTNAELKDESDESRSPLFRSFRPTMNDVAARLDCTLDNDPSVRSRSGTPMTKGVLLQFETTDRSEIDELALRVEKELSMLAGSYDAKLTPIREEWPNNHFGSFEFFYSFADGTSGKISGGVEVDGTTSRFAVQIAEG